MEVPIGNILTAMATVAAVVVANILTNRQTSAAKLWELRRVAYGAMLSEMSALDHLCKIAGGYIAEDAYRYFHDEKLKDVYDKRMAQHMDRFRQHFTDNYMILSDSFIKITEKFFSELSEIRESDVPFPDDDEKYIKIVGRYKPLLLDQGRREIAKRRKARRL